MRSQRILLLKFFSLSLSPFTVVSKQTLLVDSVTFLQEVRGLLCYKDVLHHVKHFVVYPHAVHSLVLRVAEGYLLDSGTDILDANRFHLQASVVLAS